jgi:hypothetical protein
MIVGRTRSSKRTPRHVLSDDRLSSPPSRPVQSGAVRYGMGISRCEPALQGKTTEKPRASGLPARSGLVRGPGQQGRSQTGTVTVAAMVNGGVTGSSRGRSSAPSCGPWSRPSHLNGGCSAPRIAPVRSGRPPPNLCPRHRNGGRGRCLSQRTRSLLTHDPGPRRPGGRPRRGRRRLPRPGAGPAVSRVRLGAGAHCPEDGTEQLLGDEAPLVW